MSHSNVISRITKLATLAIAMALMAVVASGCGGKPDYCADRSTLEASVKDLPGKATAGGMSALDAQVTTVQNDAKTLVSSAKADFPNETSAIEASINQLQSSIKALPEKPSTSQMVSITFNATAVVNSVKSFSDATSEACK